MPRGKRVPLQTSLAIIRLWAGPQAHEFPKSTARLTLQVGSSGTGAMVPSESWGDDFMVPADAEIIIEGEILLDRTMG